MFRCIIMQGVVMNVISIYSKRIQEIKEALKYKTLEEIEGELSLDSFDYTGVGFGYNFKDSKPENMNEAIDDTKISFLDELAVVSI